ncbi:MAG: pyruvate kinase alpha/beta domain-containing protein [Deltaproteobacteria bacterium]|nr:pyruvate kinase alpha/beta domain-containing protein [Deltaproteobacteria bacterium]
MSKGVERTIFYFEEKGPVNTEKTLEIALNHAKGANIGTIVLASSTGDTALKLHQMAEGSVKIVSVTYNAGSRFEKAVATFNENREALEQKEIFIVRGLHALSGGEKAFSAKYNTTLLPLNIVADTLRMFSQGVKVCVEIAVMAAEHGFVTTDAEVVLVAGSGHGADTALVMKPVFAEDMFKAKIKALLCMPG